MQVLKVAFFECLGSAQPCQTQPGPAKSSLRTSVKLGLAQQAILWPVIFFYTPVVFVYFMSSLYVQCRKWFMVHTLIPFPVIMWHIYFRFSLILLVTFDVNSHQWSKWLNDVLSDLIGHNNSFEIVFSFGFWFGNNWLGLYTSSSFFSLGFVSNIHAVVLAMVGLAFLSATLNGSKPDIGLSTTPFKLASIFVHMYFAWRLFASQNGPGPSWTKLYTLCTYHQLFNHFNDGG